MRFGNRHAALRTIKVVHTIIWAFFVTCIAALPVAGLQRRFDWALALSALVLVECAVIATNRGPGLAHFSRFAVRAGRWGEGNNFVVVGHDG